MKEACPTAEVYQSGLSDPLERGSSNPGFKSVLQLLDGFLVLHTSVKWLFGPGYLIQVC